MKKFLIFASGFALGALFATLYISVKATNSNIYHGKADSTAITHLSKIDSIVIVHDVGRFRVFLFNYPVNLDYVYGFMKDNDCKFVYGTLKPFMKEDPGNIKYFKKIDDSNIPIAGIRSVSDGVLYNSEGNDKYMALNTYDYQTNTFSEKKLYCGKKEKMDCWFIGVRLDKNK